MNISHLNIGIVHSLIGKNDGVSIVIDQSVKAMTEYMEIPLGNIFFLSAHCSPRFNAETNEIFWHKNPLHKKIIHNFSNPSPPPELSREIHAGAQKAKKIIADFVRRNNIDLLIAHNTSHPYNFITAVGIGYYIEECRKNGLIWPKVLVWWHDSYFERSYFGTPGDVIMKYLKYLPGLDIDGIAFINHIQCGFAREHLSCFSDNIRKYKDFFERRTDVIPNTCEINWKWKRKKWGRNKLVHPPQDDYNADFFKDIGLLHALEDRGFRLEDAVILLQHTRVVPRKRIDVALDFAFKLEKRFRKDKKCVVLLVSGHSGDERNEYKKELKTYYSKKTAEDPGAHVIFHFGERNIISHRDIIVDKKFYRFSEIPSIIAAHGGIGTYFSEHEGFGNNLLEMVCSGLPAVINRYDVYKNEIEHLGFDFPHVDGCKLDRKLIKKAYTLLTEMKTRNKMVKHNLQVADRKLSHKIIADKLTPLIYNILFRA